MLLGMLGKVWTENLDEDFGVVLEESNLLRVKQENLRGSQTYTLTMPTRRNPTPGQFQIFWWEKCHGRELSGVIFRWELFRGS